MRLSGVKWCDFIVFTQVDCLVIRIDYDMHFVEDMFFQINSFFFNHMILEHISPCESIHIKQQILIEQEFILLKNASFNIDIVKDSDFTSKDIQD